MTPGTRQVTVGGAVAADVHGKNHHRDGSIGGHVSSMDLLTADGGSRARADDDPELFWATVGGMGLTGVVVEVTLRLLPVQTSPVDGNHRARARPRGEPWPGSPRRRPLPLLGRLDRLPGRRGRLDVE